MAIVNNVDPEGGDPPCWAHLFDDESCPDKDHGADAGTMMAAGLRVDERAKVDSRRADSGGARAGSTLDAASDGARELDHHAKRD